MRMALIVEENMWAKRLQNASLVHAAEKICLIDGDILGTQRVDDTPMGRGAAGSDDGGFQKTLVIPILFFSLVFEDAEIAQLAKHGILRFSITLPHV